MIKGGIDDIGVVNLVLVIFPFVGISLYVALRDDMALPVVILCACVSIGLLIILTSGGSKDKDQSIELSDVKKQILVDKKDSPDVILAKLKLCDSLEEDPEPILVALRDRCRKVRNSKFINDAMRIALHKHVLSCVAEIPATSNSAKFALCADIMVALMKKCSPAMEEIAPPVNDSVVAEVSSQSVKKMEQREFLDALVLFLQNQLRKMKQMKAVMGDQQQPSTQEAPALDSFESQAYKYLMLLGFAGEDNPIGQNLLGDRGGIQVLMEYLKYFADNKTFVKWCCWALIHTTYNHPPNKAEVVRSEGIGLVVTCLRQHTKHLTQGIYDYGESTSKGDTTEADTYYQAIALLYNVMMPDNQAKVNLAQVRQAALHSGLVDIAQGIQRKYKDNENLSNIVSFLLSILMSDYS